MNIENKNYTTVCFTNPWPSSTPDMALKSKMHTTPDNNGIWHNIKGATDPYTADWVIGWETLDPYLDMSRIDPSRVILTGREPPWILAIGGNHKDDNWDSFPDVKYKFKCALGNSYLLASWTSRIFYKDMKKFSWAPRKRKLCIVMSNKLFCPGHFIRLEFIKRFCYKYPGVLDIYGNGALQWCQENDLTSRWKGASPYCLDDTKHVWISRYNYSLAFENGVLDGHFTEKFTDIMMAYTKPIYWGARDIGKYFPENSFEYLDITKEDACDRLYNMIQNPMTEEDVLAIGKSRDLIMDVYGEWPSIKRIIDTGDVMPEWLRQRE